MAVETKAAPAASRPRRSCSSRAARRSRRPASWPTSTSSPPIPSALRHGHAGLAKMSPTASWTASTSWPRASTAVRDRQARLAVGARVFCGSSGVGWMYALEALTVTPALRVPMVAMVGNRALDDPGAFGVEHNDALAVRDLGWQLVWVDTAQEALDTALIAYRVAEDRRIFLPCAICCDGAFLTHSQALVKSRPQEKVKAVPAPLRPRRSPAPPRQPDHRGPAGERGLAHGDPPPDRRRHGALPRPSSARPTPTSTDLRPALRESVLRGVQDRRRRGRAGRHGHALDPVKVAIRQMRQEGRRSASCACAGSGPSLPRSWRRRLGRFKAVGVIDRDFSLGSPYYERRPRDRGAGRDVPGRQPAALLGFICGLGGREVTLPDVKKMTDSVFQPPRRKAQPANRMDRIARVAAIGARGATWL